MKALVYDGYGAPDVVRWVDVAAPEPGPRDLWIDVKATTVSSGDARMRAARFPAGMATLGRLALGWSRPRKRVLGVELAGVVRAVGAEVTGFRAGDRVLAMTGMRMGAHAEQAIVAFDHCAVRLPDDVPFADAVCLPFGGATALTFLEEKARLSAGERVLVVGASGAVGAACVQVARLLGAEVTAVCSGANRDLVTTLGANRVIDYTVEDVFASGDAWDVVVDTVGVARVSALRKLMTRRGRLALVAAGLPQMLLVPWFALTSRQRLLVGPAGESPAYLERLIGWVRDGSWKTVIDATYPLADGAAAHARVDSNHKRGSVVLVVDAGSTPRGPSRPFVR